MPHTLNPAKIAESASIIGARKSSRTVFELMILGFMAGAFVALAAQGSSTAAHSITNVGVARLITGAVFSTSLMMVLVSGGELFVGNTLIVIAVLEKRTSVLKMLKNWTISYIGNFIGACTVAFLVFQTHQFNYSAGLLGGFTIKIATDKISLTFMQAFVSGILCSWIVCTGVWMSYATTQIVGKFMSAFIAITLFVTSGFDNSIANMYYIPAGIFAAKNAIYVRSAMSLGVENQSLESLNWVNMIIKNFLPATLGNIVGGAGFVGVLYWIAFLKNKKNEEILNYD